MADFDFDRWLSAQHWFVRCALRFSWWIRRRSSKLRRQRNRLNARRLLMTGNGRRLRRELEAELGRRGLKVSR